MTKLEAALLDLGAFLDELRIPYMVIGGFANLYWGVERFTRDLDLTVEVADEALPEVLRRLGERLVFAVSEPLTFARRNHLVRARVKSGVDVDLILAVLPYELAAIRRAVTAEVSGGRIRMCSAEDLIIHKLASERPQDAVDVEGIVLRQASRVDRDYLWPLVRDLAAGLERPEIVGFLARVLKDADSRTGGGGRDG